MLVFFLWNEKKNNKTLFNPFHTFFLPTTDSEEIKTATKRNFTASPEMEIRKKDIFHLQRIEEAVTVETLKMQRVFHLIGFSE